MGPAGPRWAGLLPKQQPYPAWACLLQVIDDSSTDSLLLVMEYVEGGSLEAPYDRATRRWDPVPEAKVLRLFREVLKVPVCLIAPPA